jgi:hypothetical protein
MLSPTDRRPSQLPYGIGRHLSRAWRRNKGHTSPAAERNQTAPAAGISTASTEVLLQRMLDKIETLCTERDKLRGALPKPAKVKAQGGGS